MKLAALQERFLTAVLDDACMEGVMPVDAIDVYRRNARANFHAALCAAFPVVRRLVGDAFFGEAAHRYARMHPSTSGDLHGFGSQFPTFIAGYGPALSLDYLPDVARLEWAVHESFHAADAPHFDFEALARVPADRHRGLRFRLAPDVRLVASPHPVLAIWEANQPGRDATPELAEGSDHIVVHRERFEATPKRIDAATWRFLEALAGDAALEQACIRLGPEGESRLPALLAHWICLGVIAAFEAPADHE